MQFGLVQNPQYLIQNREMKVINILQDRIPVILFVLSSTLILSACAYTPTLLTDSRNCSFQAPIEPRLLPDGVRLTSISTEINCANGSLNGEGLIEGFDGSGRTVFLVQGKFINGTPDGAIYARKASSFGNSTVHFNKPGTIDAKFYFHNGELTTVTTKMQNGERNYRQYKNGSFNPLADTNPPTQEIDDLIDKTQRLEQAKKGSQWALTAASNSGYASQNVQLAADHDAKPAKLWPNARPVPTALRDRAAEFSRNAADPSLRPLFERLYIEGERNAVLNWQRIGLGALHLGQIDLAERAFEQAVQRIDQVYADNEQAAKARSLWNAEAVKDFKGEPYERAMAMFYRGLVYAARGDFQNARALFKSAEYQDTVSEDEQYQSDFALMHHMSAWASYCDRDARLGREYHDRSKKADPVFGQAQPNNPVLVLVETGRAPFKFATGQHRQALRWSPHPLPDSRVVRACSPSGGQPACLRGDFLRAADIGFQATTRGGRQVDAILAGKAKFKDNAQDVADVSNSIAAIALQTSLVTGSSDSAGLGLLGMFVGLAAQAASNATQAQADIREWEQLPEKIWMHSANQLIKADTMNVTVESAGQSVTVRARRIADGARCQLFLGRDRTPLADTSELGPIVPGEHPADERFRAGLGG